jgi:triacylglycerol esterase/lipase EstA (alpha/beta hydrolase family)
MNNFIHSSLSTSIQSKKKTILNQYFRLIRKLMMAGLKTKSIHLIGHSLGAHICSYIGANLGGVGRITGEIMCIIRR